MTSTGASSPIQGRLTFPSTWAVYSPVLPDADPLPVDQLQSIPKQLTLNGQVVEAKLLQTTRHQYDFKPFFGPPPYRTSHAAYVFIPLQSDIAQIVTLGMGADFYMRAWVNGQLLLDTTRHGNGQTPPAINNHLVNATLQEGANILVVQFMNGKGPAILALGGPDELHAGDFQTIAPLASYRPGITSAADLYAQFPTDPAAPITWKPPASFNPAQPCLGLPQLQEAEHHELLHAIPSQAAIEDGGPGVYESIAHGTWNHGARICVFKDYLVVSWQQHVIDEGGPGTRVVARWGKRLDEHGRVDWGDDSHLIEAGPPPVPVRRRTMQFERDVIRIAHSRGHFQIIDGKLFFCGYLVAKHGICTDRRFCINSGEPLIGNTVAEEHYFFEPSPLCVGGGNVQWDLGYRYYQEWDVVDGQLQTVSPIYRENDLAPSLPVTPVESIKLAPLQSPFTESILLADAPREVRATITQGKREDLDRVPRFTPGVSNLAADGIHGVVWSHSSEYQRLDGKWVCIHENQGPPAQKVYYAETKEHAEDNYPPLRRTNLFGAVKPFAGTLPDGRNYIVCNSHDRRNMYLTVSEDGVVFDKTWLLLHRQLKDFTPGMMKSQGGPGAGPQYFKAAIVGQSLWVVYSISKEHVGATRVPLESLG